MNQYERPQWDDPEEAQPDLRHGVRTRYWIFVMKKGRWVNIGSEASEEEAYERAVNECPDYHYEIRAYNTSSVDEAQRRWRYDILAQTHNLDNAMQRMVRKPAEVRQKKKEDNGDDEDWARI